MMLMLSVDRNDDDDDNENYGHKVLKWKNILSSPSFNICCPRSHELGWWVDRNWQTKELGFFVSLGYNFYGWMSFLML